MKILHARGSLVNYLALFSTPLTIFIFIWICFWGEGVIDYVIFLFIAIASAISILIGAFLGLRIYNTHWILYGNGKVIIRRVSKKREGGGMIGGWEDNEDEFLVEDIEAYGLSSDILGHSVEYHLCSSRYEAECFFQLKGGKRIGYETSCYLAKDMKEFFDYIVEETGLEFQPPEKLRWNRKNKRRQ